MAILLALSEIPDVRRVTSAVFHRLSGSRKVALRRVGKADSYSAWIARKVWAASSRLDLVDNRAVLVSGRTGSLMTARRPSSVVPLVFIRVRHNRLNQIDRDEWLAVATAVFERLDWFPEATVRQPRRRFDPVAELGPVCLAAEDSQHEVDELLAVFPQVLPLPYFVSLAPQLPVNARRGDPLLRRRSLPPLFEDFLDLWLRYIEHRAVLVPSAPAVPAPTARGTSAPCSGSLASRERPAGSPNPRPTPCADHVNLLHSQHLLPTSAPRL